MPIAEVLGQSARNVALGILSRLADGSVYAIYALFSSTFLVTAAGLSRATAISAVTVASVLLAFTIPCAGWLSDKVGWRRLYILSSLVSGVAAFPLLWVMQYSGSPTLAFLAIVVGLGVLWAPVYAPQAALFCSLFETRVKYTGISLVYHFGAIIGISFTPIAAIGLLAIGQQQAVVPGHGNAGRLSRRRRQRVRHAPGWTTTRRRTQDASPSLTGKSREFLMNSIAARQSARL